MKAGAWLHNDGSCSFRVWAPLKKSVTLHIVHPSDEYIPMTKDCDGYFYTRLENAAPGTRYFFITDNAEELPDPASQCQPDGVFGASAVADHDTYKWKSDCKSIYPEKAIMYELHIGTFTQEGTFTTAIAQLDDLVSLGINTILLMPVSQFPGARNWGYDGVFPYAVQNSYGTSDELKQLIDACHEKGLSVMLDVVYNHLGPEGNIFAKYGPYFSETYYVPWGKAINYDGSYSDEVRDFFIGNMLYWLEYYRFDGLRLDAIHAIFDSSAVHLWEEAFNRIQELKHRTGRSFFIMAESDLNDPKTIKSPETGGFGFDAQWLDDFHHALYVLLDKNGQERYMDFGETSQVAKAYKEGFVYSGEYVHFRKRKHGRSSAGVPGNRFVVFNQNHDQVGNRILGERLSELINFEMLKVAAAALLMAPYIPLLFMGEEYAAGQPFLFFTDHSEEQLIAAVRKGRQKEFERSGSADVMPDPQSQDTFRRSKLNWQEREKDKHKILLQWYRELISLRNEYDVFRNYNKDQVHVQVVADSVFTLLRSNVANTTHILCIFNLSDNETGFRMPGHDKIWNKHIDSNATCWQWQPGEQKELPGKVFSDTALQIPRQNVVIYIAVNEQQKC